MNMQNFFMMGGYGFYVWLAYGLAAVVLIGNIVAAVLQRRRYLRLIQAWLIRQQSL